MPQLSVTLEKWPLANPFRITGYLYYRGDRPEGILGTLEAVRGAVERGIDRPALQALLPSGGARNALDCALWDLEAKLTGCPAWKTAGLPGPPVPLLTTFTCGADMPERMARAARG